MPEGRSGQPRIDAYSFGRIEVDGRTYTSDVVILPTGVKGDWWREEGHMLKPADLAEVLDASPDVLVVGQGAQACMKVAEETLVCLEQAGIKPVCAPTARAVEVYNERAQRGENVVAALHLTC